MSRIKYSARASTDNPGRSHGGGNAPPGTRGRPGRAAARLEISRGWMVDGRGREETESRGVPDAEHARDDKAQWNVRRMRTRTLRTLICGHPQG